MVMVDRGYGPAESWVKARVCDQREVDSLFEGKKINLLVEFPGGERDWISFWEEIPNA